MSITFRDRKYHRGIDASFTLYDGAMPSKDVDNWHVGDAVSLIFEVSPQQAKAVNDFGTRDFAIYDVHSRNGRKCAHIPCIVVSRSHCAAWMDVGKFRQITGTSVVLEASTGEWEDLLKWIVLGEKPKWAE